MGLGPLSQNPSGSIRESIREPLPSWVGRTLVHNERTKLLANALDRASTGLFMVGVATPAASSLYGSTPHIGIAFLMVAFYVWLFAAFRLHMLARRVLKGLRE